MLSELNDENIDKKMPHVLEVKNLSKSFPGVKALQNVDLGIRHGEIHALVGENGAGKSTLIKILAGVYTNDEGEISVCGKKVHIKRPLDSQMLGLAFIHQELNLVANFSGYENIILGMKYPRSKFGNISWRKLEETVRQQSKLLGIDFSLKKPVSSLAVAEQWMIAICRALMFNAKVIVMDEPTGSLTENEVERLFTTIKSLKDSGISIIYVSHRMEEIFELADRITVLKDGCKIGTIDKDDASPKKLISMMLGRELTDMYPSRKVPIGEPVLKVENLSRQKAVNDVSFTLHAGEILGFSGLIGSGRTEVARLICGLDHKDGGAIYLNGQKVEINRPSDAVKKGIVLLPEERRSQGSFLQRNLAENISIASLPRYRYWPYLGVINSNKETTEVSNYIKTLNIKASSTKQQMRSLSGGNQQKAILARWLATQAKVFIFDEPTRGIDVGTKKEIYNLIMGLAENGVSIIVISSDLPEVIGISDRVLVMSEKKIVGELCGADITEENILHCCYGGE